MDDVAPVTLASPDAQLALPRPATFPTLRVFAPDGSETRLLADPNTSSFAWISGPDRVVFTQRRDGTTWVVAADPTTGNLEPLLPTGDSPTLLASPDGKRLVCHRAGSPQSRHDHAPRPRHQHRVRDSDVSQLPKALLGARLLSAPPPFRRPHHRLRRRRQPSSCAAARWGALLECDVGPRRVLRLHQELSLPAPP